MDIKQLKLLKDIFDCIESIETYLGEQKLFDAYVNNPLLQDAVERNIITIGEAMNSLLKLNPSISISTLEK